MNEIWSDIGNAARRIADRAVTGVSVAALEQKLGDAYRALGRMYHQAVKEGEPLEGPAFSEKLAQIQDLQRQIKEKKEK